MQNFTFYNPTQVVFGKDTISKLPRLLGTHQKILFLYGHESIKKNGLYQKVLELLGDRELVEHGGVDPNPKYEHCLVGIEKIRKENCTFILAVGGGSVIDAAKFIAAGVKLATDPWDILLGKAKINEALPLGAVLTLPATGSEMNANSVISRASSDEKLAFASSYVFPQFAILDPQITYSLSMRQLQNGLVDAFVHVLEQYATTNEQALVQDGFCETVMKTLVQVTADVKVNPPIYDARANFMWAATMGLNGLIGVGAVQDWSTHGVGHELTAFYGLDHAQSLAIVFPALARFQKERKKEKLIQLVRNVFGMKDCSDVDAAIERIESYFRDEVGVKMKLSQYGVDSLEAADRVSERFKQRGTRLGEEGSLDYKAVYEILRSC